MDQKEIHSQFKEFLEEIGSYYGLVDDQETQIIRKKQDLCYDLVDGIYSEYTKCIEFVDSKYESMNNTFKFQTEKYAKDYLKCIQNDQKKISDCSDKTWRSLHQNMKIYLDLLRKINAKSN